MYIEKEVTVGELKSLFNSNQYEIDISSPDGYQRVSKWFDKGMMPIIKIGTENHQTECADNHLIQLSTGEWMLAAELNIGDNILTETGPEQIILREDISEQECYDFTVDHPNHRYFGDGISSHNSGKSYFASGNIIREAQKQDIMVVLIDSENALDEKWLEALGVDTSEEKLMRIGMSMVDDVAKTISTFMKDYKTMDEATRPKVLFVIDSLGMLMTPTDVDQFQKGDMKGDFGRKPKSLTSLVRNCVNMFGAHNVGLVATNHTYASQDMFDPDDKISGGQGFIYASSIVIAMKKLKLKVDADGVKGAKVHGIRAKCKIMKTRYAKPFEEAELHIPWDTGLDPYSGLVDAFEEKGIFKKQGNRLSYTTLDGEEIIEFRKNWTSEKLDIVMEDIRTAALLGDSVKVEHVEPEAEEVEIEDQD